MAANRKLLAAAAACAAAVIGVTGCSSDGDKDPFEGMSADKIAKKAVDASKGAGSFKVSGQGEEDGKKVQIDFAVAESGDCQGKTGSAANGTGEILVVDKTSYFKGDEQFWKSTGSAAMGDKLKGRWMKSPRGEDSKTCDKDEMFNSAKLKGLKREKDAEVDGEKAAVLTKKTGKKQLTYYVALDGKPYFLRIEEKGADPTKMNFSDYGKSVVVKAPPADQVIEQKDLKDLLTG
ncbi:hypothetical protein [Streptomyces sp. NRRL B-1347]|uniref:hypothetical protein n=1 Tax=Streptomyces sp. NRRL B-1347 TaxID=1476877 RepID=UPI00068C9549|nr:hypothetical protein [Streptomyces sp. NRRL B-1347]